MKKNKFLILALAVVALCVGLVGCANEKAKPMIKKITADKEISVEVGKSAKIQIIIEPNEAKNLKVNMKSADEKIATVDKDGNVKGVKMGETEINIKAEKGEANTSVKIKVVETKNKPFSITDKDIEVKNKEKGNTVVIINSNENTKKIKAGDTLVLMVKDKELGSKKFGDKEIEMLKTQNLEIALADMNKNAMEEMDSDTNKEVLISGTEVTVKIKLKDGGEASFSTTVKAK